MRSRITLWELFFLSLLILVSLYPRLWHLTTAPPVIVDEPAYLRDIDAILKTGSWFFPANSQWDFSQATLFYYPTIFLAGILGTSPNLFTLRLSAVIFSLLALIPFYFLAKEYVHKIIALCLVLLFSFSYYYLQFSRVGWGVVSATALGLYLIWFLQIAFRRPHPFWFALPGATAGIILYGYRAGEIYLAAGFLYLISTLIAKKLCFKRTLLIFSIFGGSFLLTSAPWLYRISNNWELYNSRQRVVWVFSAERPYHGFWKESDILKYQLSTTVRSWILLEAVDGGGIENPRYLPLKDPPVNLAVRILFLAGAILAVLRFKETFLWLTIFILGLILGQILTVDPPNGSRALVFLPIIYFFSAFTLEKLYQLSERSRLFLIIMVVFALIIAYNDFTYYQNWMRWICSRI